MRGQPFNITEFVELKEPKKSAYQERFRGLQNKALTKKADVVRDSIVNHVSPDPTMVKNLTNRKQQFSKDMLNMTVKTFSYSGGESFGNRSQLNNTF